MRDSPKRDRQIVVVGGGVIGCAAAFQLGRAGFRVTLVERDGVAAHASGLSAGKLNPLHGTPPGLTSLTLQAFRIHAEVRNALAELGLADFLAYPVQRLHIGFDESDRASLEETARLYQSFEDFSSTWLDRDALRRTESRLGKDAAFGVLTEGNLSVDGAGFTRALAEGAKTLGATILKAAASGIVTEGERVTGIVTDRGVIACDEVVFATGPWVAEVGGWLGVDLPVEPVKGEILRMRLPSDAPRFDLTWGLTSVYRRLDKEVWVGVTVAKVGFDAAPTAEARTLLLDRAARIFPEIRDAELVEHVAALRPIATPNAPIARRAEGWRNVFLANGGGAKGILLSVGIANRIRDLLLDESGQVSP